MKKKQFIPFDLDFLREIGYEFGLDWDGQLIIEYPESIDIDKLTNLIKSYDEEIRECLYFEGRKAKRIFVGGPLNGKQYFNYYIPNNPICRHIKRGEWAVYMVKEHDDPRAWFMGIATNKKKAKSLIF